METDPQIPSSPTPTPPPPDVSSGAIPVPTPTPSPTPSPSPVPPPPSLTPPPPAPPPPPGLISEPAKPQPPKPAPVAADEEPDVESLPAGSEAPFNARVVGALIDCFVALGLYIAILIVMPRSLQFLGGLIYLAYMLTRDALPFLDGQSIGKKVMKIKAVDLQGKSLAGNWSQGIVRNVTFVIPVIPLVELFLLYTKNDKGQPLRRLGDEWGKTKVITAPETTTTPAA